MGVIETLILTTALAGIAEKFQPGGQPAAELCRRCDAQRGLL